MKKMRTSEIEALALCLERSWRIHYSSLATVRLIQEVSLGVFMAPNKHRKHLVILITGLFCKVAKLTICLRCPTVCTYDCGKIRARSVV